MVAPERVSQLAARPRSSMRIRATTAMEQHSAAFAAVGQSAALPLPVARGAGEGSQPERHSNLIILVRNTASGISMASRARFCHWHWHCQWK